MKNFRKLSVIALALCMLLPIGVQAKTKNIYVVSSVKIKNHDGKYTEKITYKDGFIKSIKSNIQDEIFSYKSDHKLNQVVRNVKSGDDKGKTVNTYTWKNSHIKKVVSQSDSGTNVYKYKWQNGVPVSLTIKGEGEYYDIKTIYKFKWKDGKVIKELTDYNLTNKYYYDKKGNTKKYITKMNGSDTIKFTSKNTYKNGKLKKTKETFSLPDFGEKFKGYRIYTYKKIRVKTSDIKAIKEQQWQLTNPYVTAFAW